MRGKWRSELSTAPAPVATMLLLTDGRVLCQHDDEGQWQRWWLLTPDVNGQYVTGSWSEAAPMECSRCLFASAVMADGTVIVAGGEHGGTNAVLVGGRRPQMLVESYDPVSNQWQTLPSLDDFGWQNISDAPCAVLADGRLLVGSRESTRVALFRKRARFEGSWARGMPKPSMDSEEETWVLLADGSVLAINVHNEDAVRYVPGHDEEPGDWVPAGRPDPRLSESKETGPAVLLADGRVLAFGATGMTSFYHPPEAPGEVGSWTCGPVIPPDPDATPEMVGSVATDNPACLLPDGTVLSVVGPATTGSINPAPPCRFILFSEEGLDRIDAPGSDDPTIAAGNCQLLVLPTGEAMFTNGSRRVAFYVPGGQPRPEWRPEIVDVPGYLSPGSVYRLSGRQLNGLSQSMSYGDDVSAATNYPLVQVRRDERVWYCRTFDHSTMGVATGEAVHTTCFQLPWSVPPGACQLRVITNGIASEPRAVEVAGSLWQTELIHAEVIAELKARHAADDPEVVAAIGHVTEAMETVLRLKQRAAEVIFDEVKGGGRARLYPV